MNGVALAAALALPTASAYAAIGRFERGVPQSLAWRVLRAGLAVPLGLGAGSLLTFAWLMAGGTLGTIYAAADFLLFAAVLVAASRGRAPRGSRDGAPLSALDVAAIAAVLAALALAAASFAQASFAQPHGEWDAWATWNQRARFLFRGGEQWRAAFAPDLGFSHTGYPLLLPTVVARLWAYSGETVAAPAVAAALFTLAPPVVVLGAGAHRAGWLVGATGALLTVAARRWGEVGVWQYADMPVGCFVVAGVAAVLAGRREDGSDDPFLYALGGALLALSAWTKDEGLLLVLVFGAWALASPRLGSWRTRGAALAAGAALPLAARVAFQLLLAPGFAGTFAAGTGSPVARLVDGGRWVVILAEMPRHVPGSETALPVVVAAAAISLGARWRELPRSPVIPALATVGAILLVYGMTPLDVQWHVSRSASRVLLQPWAAFVLGVFHLVPPHAGEGATPLGGNGSRRLRRPRRAGSLDRPPPSR